MTEAQQIDFQVTTGYGYKTQQPFVNVTVGAQDFHVQMSPEDAASLAHNLMAAAEASIGDAFLIEWLRNNIGASDGQVAQLLQEFREYREGREEARS